MGALDAVCGGVVSPRVSSWVLGAVSPLYPRVLNLQVQPTENRRVFVLFWFGSGLWIFCFVIPGTIESRGFPSSVSVDGAGPLHCLALCPACCRFTSCLALHAWDQLHLQEGLDPRSAECCSESKTWLPGVPVAAGAV